MLRKRDDLITTTEAAEMLGVARTSVQIWVEKGMLRALKTPGGHRRIPRDSVETLLNSWNRSVGSEKSEDNLSILVVEDDQVMLELYVSAINSWNFPVNLRTAENGFEGLIQVGRKEPSIIITDLKMPGMDGFQFVRSLKETTDLVGIKIIAVTSLEPEEIKKNGDLPIGVQVFQKPPPLNRIKELAKLMYQAQFECL
jgi:excisionase family DNA binding protein